MCPVSLGVVLGGFSGGSTSSHGNFIHTFQQGVYQSGSKAVVRTSLYVVFRTFFHGLCCVTAHFQPWRLCRLKVAGRYPDERTVEAIVKRPTNLWKSHDWRRSFDQDPCRLLHRKPKALVLLPGSI